ncbi:hypothetical protein P8C59_002873 [Phyllachora maydis]|uniref:Uncharacterized protein n=1 Tax=Phyllachora maydis TaxID=1825666 RepID=A0AAD9M8I5_9PEZI|nr:hypothetical protein P8C59_002873 [Phyllachora maydis]
MAVPFNSDYSVEDVASPPIFFPQVPRLDLNHFLVELDRPVVNAPPSSLLSRPDELPVPVSSSLPYTQDPRFDLITLCQRDMASDQILFSVVALSLVGGVSAISTRPDRFDASCSFTAFEGHAESFP